MVVDGGEVLIFLVVFLCVCFMFFGFYSWFVDSMIFTGGNLFAWSLFTRAFLEQSSGNGGECEWRERCCV